MSFFMTGSEFSAALLEAPIGLVLIVKWTILLALAWLAHGLFAGRNPRWPVALWRSTVAGLGLAAVLSEVAPVMTYRLVPSDPPRIEVASVVPASPDAESTALPSRSCA